MPISLLTLLLVAAVADAASVRPAPDVRVEAFVLERSTPEGPEPVAVVELRAVQGAASLLLEQDVSFRVGGVRILHDEERAADGWHLVRRELRGPVCPGRSFSVEPDGAGGMRVLRWGTSVAVHERWPESSPRLPLELLESLRIGREPSSSVSFFDPLAEAVVPIEVTVVPDEAVGGGVDARTVELRRADGSLAGRYEFRGAELVAFQWQDGARRARRIEPAEARRLAARWRVEHDPTAEVWAAVRAGRVRRR